MNSMCIPLNILSVPITWKSVESKIHCHSVQTDYSCSGCNISSLHSTILFSTVLSSSAYPILNTSVVPNIYQKKENKILKIQQRHNIESFHQHYWHESKALAENPK